MLRDLRAAGVPPELLAVILGTSRDTVDGWRKSYRNPSGAALRCIWLVHRLWMGDAPRTLDDWFLWLPPRTPAERADAAAKLEALRGLDGDGI